MALSDVQFIKYSGGLGRALEGEDHISGLVMTSATVPASFPAERVSVFFSVSEAEAAGLTVADYPAVHAQIAQYFTVQPQGQLYVSLSADAPLEDELVGIQNFAEGKIRQVAVMDTATFSLSTFAALQGKAVELEAAHKGLVVLYSATFTGQTIASLPDLTTANSQYVTVSVGADASGANALGTLLGTVSLSKVSDNVGAVKQFNVSKGAGFDVLAFTTGETYRGVTDAQLSSLKAKGYVFLRKYTGFAGSFFSDSNTATSPLSDFAYLENVRTIQKAERVIRVALLPELHAPLRAKNGILDATTIAHFELLVKNQLESMVNASELETFSIAINPAQNVLATSKLEIQVGLTPLGVARQIVVGLGFEL